jgi:hypothetical protein
MSSDAKTEANRANAQKSTGPKTEAGKYISSRNNMRHGLRSNTKILPGEDLEEFNILSSGMLADLNPLDTTETELVNQLVDIQWRLRRAGDFEAKVLTGEAPDFKGLNTMSLHAARLKRQFSKPLEEFETRHARNVKTHNREFPDAVKIHKADEILNRPSTLQDLGFEWTAADLDRHEARKDALKYAEEVIDEWQEEQDTADIEEFERMQRGKYNKQKVA